jgi:segregation and condensation protein B
MSDINMKRIIEALLIATDIPLPLKKIVEITEASNDDVRHLISELNQEYRGSQRAFEIKEIAGGYQIYTLPEFVTWVGSLHDHKSKLSKAALETLAIIAYHQPITRAEIEKVRGVDSTYILDALLQKGLIKTCGRLPVPGRPIRYGTTKEFLRYFGIKELSDLPREADFGEIVTHNSGDDSDDHPAISHEEHAEEESVEAFDTESQNTADDEFDAIEKPREFDTEDSHPNDENAV